MTRLFTDGEEMGSTLGIKPDPTVWKVSNSIKRSGAYSYMENGASCWIETAVNNLTERLILWLSIPLFTQIGLAR